MYKRYKRTEQILREAGMYNITMQTQELEKKNALLQLEIEQFNRDVSAFVQDVLKNPQNKWLRDKILQKSQRRSKWISKLLLCKQLAVKSFLVDLARLFLDVFPQLSPTQVGETLSFSKKSLSFSENSLSFSENSLSLFKRMEFFFQNSLNFPNFLALFSRKT